METSARQTLCSVCGQRSAIYTCPCCATRTCSLPCSRLHKTLQSCSGMRDTTAYVPMNKYSWGTMMNDYVYLEEVGRKTVEWGTDIVKGGFHASAAATARGRGRGRGRGSAPRNGGRGKRDVLRMQLDTRDIDMEILPPGMVKRRLNQSTWDARRKTVLMTLELVFHPTRDPLSPSHAPMPPSFSLLIHRNDLNHTLREILRKHITERRKKETLPSWVQSLVTNDEDDDDSVPLYLIAQPAMSPQPLVSNVFHKLDEAQPLGVCLRHKSFVEYPTIDVWARGGFTGAFMNTDGSYVEGEDPPPLAKHRRLDTVGGQKIIKSLLGDYRSDDEDQEEQENVLRMLDDYASEEEPGAGEDHSEDDHMEEEEYDDEEPTLEALRDIFEAAGHDATLADDQIVLPEGEDEVDWVDSGEDEVEALEQALKQQRASRQTG